MKINVFDYDKIIIIKEAGNSYALTVNDRPEAHLRGSTFCFTNLADLMAFLQWHKGDHEK